MRVIILHDDAADRATIARELRREFDSVDAAEVVSEDELLQRLDEPAPDLIVMDSAFTWADSLEILRRMRSRHPDVPILMYSSTATESFMTAAVEAGASDYMLKLPGHEYRLRVFMRSALDHGNRRRQQQRQMALGVEVAASVAKSSVPMRTMLQGCARAVVDKLDAAYVQIWLLNQSKDVLEMAAGSGRYASYRGITDRVRVGEHPVGWIALERRPYLTNSGIGVPSMIREGSAPPTGFTSFAGYPLTVADRVVGVLTMISDKPISQATMDALGSVADLIAQGTERKRYEEALAESRNKYASLLKHIPDVVWTADETGRFSFITANVTALTGYTTAEFLSGGKKFWVEKLHPNDIGAVQQAYSMLFHPGGSYDIEYQVRKKDGHWIWVHDRSTSIYRKDGAVYADGILSDVTEALRDRQMAHFLARTSAALASSLEYESMLKEVVQLAVPELGTFCSLHFREEDGSIKEVAFAHSDSNVLEALKELRKHVRYDPNQPFGVPYVLKTGEPDFVPVVTDAMLERAAPNPETLSYWRTLSACSYMVVPIKSEGRVRGAISFVNGRLCRSYDDKDLNVASDLANRIGLALENCLLYNRARTMSVKLNALATVSQGLAGSLEFDGILQILANSCVPVVADFTVVYRIDSSDKIRRVAAAHASPRLKFAAKALLNQGLGRHLEEKLREVVSSNKPVLMERIPSECINDDETPMLLRQMNPASCIFLPLAAAGKTAGIVCFAVSDSKRRFKEGDITFFEEITRRASVALDKAILHERVVQSDRTKDEFLATLSHELRTPLTAIAGWADLLYTKKLDLDKAGVAIEVIQRNVKLQARLIDDLLRINEIVSGKLSLNRVSLASDKAILAAVDSIRPAADEKGVQVQVEVQPDLKIFVDQERLQQILWNLLSNAVKFTPPGGSISVKSSFLSESLRIEVADTGIGMSKDFLPFLFERFRQADSSTTRKYGGIGLGLAIVRHLVELHGGSISARSDGEGRGSVFIVDLPLSQAFSEENRTAS